MTLATSLRTSGIFPLGITLKARRKGRDNLPAYFYFLTDEFAANKALTLLKRGANGNLQIDLSRTIRELGTARQAAEALASGKITNNPVQFSLASFIEKNGTAEDAKLVKERARLSNPYAYGIIEKKAGEKQ